MKIENCLYILFLYTLRTSQDNTRNITGWIWLVSY